MIKSHTPKIREILRNEPYGLTAKQIVEKMKVVTVKTVKSSLTKMPDVYIDRWVRMQGSRGQYQAVYMAVVPPKDCPHPKDRFPEVCKTRWVDRAQA